MPAGYRTALISIGVFLAFGGAFALVAGTFTRATGPQHVNSFVGGAFAVTCGVVIVLSAIAGRPPRWVAKVLGLKHDDD